MSAASEPPGERAEQPSEYFRYWPQGRPAVFKLKDNLILAIPPQYQKFWQQKDYVIRAPVPPDRIPQVSSIGFYFFLPDFSGFTPQNYRKDFDEDQVDVVEIEPADPKQTAPDAPGNYPPNMLKRALKGVLVPSQFTDIYGLRCYRWLPAVSRDHVTCYGRRDDTTREDIMFWANVPPYQPGTVFPMMQAEYFSGRYGGVRIVWRTNAKHMAQWRAIDSQIWKFIDSWNVANPKTAQPRASKVGS